MNQAKTERGQWAGSAIPAKKGHIVRHPACKFNPIASTCQKQPCLNFPAKSPKCFIKITGSRYNGTFLLNVDDGLDDTIYHTMREIEVALENQVDPLGKPRVSPKSCLSSVFRCFGTSEMNGKVVCKKKKKTETKPVECSLKATINQSDTGPLISAVRSNSFNPTSETSNQSVMRNVVDVFQTTLDQLRSENMSASEDTPSTLHLEHSQNQSLAKNKHTETSLTKPSCEDTKKVSFIRFSQEDVLVIQPPKPLNDSHELEVGIEVKPKTTAVNVGQSINLTKDKVLIGVQDGRGVLQISDAIPKRTLQMVIEEDVNGKPSMKLSLNEGRTDQKADSMQTDFTGTKFRDNPGTNGINKYYGERDSNIVKNCSSMMNTQNAYKKLRSYKSVESQVSWDHVRDANQPSKNIAKSRSASTQCGYNPMETTSFLKDCLSTVKNKPQTSDANVGNDTQESTVTCIERPHGDSGEPMYTNFRKERFPCDVHTLYEPRSLNNSSCIVSDEPSSYFSNGKVARSTQTYKKELKTEKVKPRKSNTCTSDRSSSSKCTKVFRNIGEINAKTSRPLGWKDAGMTTTLMEDFEKVLQNMCGSSYLYHNPEHSLQKPGQLERTVTVEKSNTFGMSFDQWTQTGPEHIGKYHTETKTIAHHPNYECLSRKIKDATEGRKQIKSNASQSGEGSSIVSSAEEDLTDSSDGTKSTLSYSMIESPSKKVMQSEEIDCLIKSKAQSFVGQTIFTAIEQRTIDPDLFGAVKNSDSFMYPACRDKSESTLHEEGNISVVNMALFEGPFSESTEKDAALPECFLATQEEIWDQSKAFCVTHDRISTISPIRMRSKSCQDLSTAPNTVDMNRHEPERGQCNSRQRMKLRYPQLTATDSHRASATKICSIFNFNEGETTADHTVGNNISKPDCSLPSAIRELLLPSQRSAVFYGPHELPTDYNENLSPPEYWNHDRFNQGNKWSAPNKTAESTTSLALRKSLFKKPFFAMKTTITAVGRTFCSLLRKLSSSDANKKKKNVKFNDSLVYVAIPLEKKSENLQLFTKLQ